MIPRDHSGNQIPHPRGSRCCCLQLFWCLFHECLLCFSFLHRGARVSVQGARQPSNTCTEISLNTWKQWVSGLYWGSQCGLGHRQHSAGSWQLCWLCWKKPGAKPICPMKQFMLPVHDGWVPETESTFQVWGTGRNGMGMTAIINQHYSNTFFVSFKIYLFSNWRIIAL